MARNTFELKPVSPFRLDLAVWADYAGLVYFHLLLDCLEEAGNRSEPTP